MAEKIEYHIHYMYTKLINNQPKFSKWISRRRIVMCKISKKIKKFSANDGFNAGDLCHYARDHLASAKLLFARNYRCYDSAGYLAHLGLELLLKGFILYLNGEFPSGHNLERLLKLLKIKGIPINKNDENTLKKINDFFNLRYANPKNPIEIGGDDWQVIENLSKNLVNVFPDDLKKEFENIDGSLQKGGRRLCRRPKQKIT